MRKGLEPAAARTGGCGVPQQRRLPSFPRVQQAVALPVKHTNDEGTQNHSSSQSSHLLNLRVEAVNIKVQHAASCVRLNVLRWWGWCCGCSWRCCCRPGCCCRHGLRCTPTCCRPVSLLLQVSCRSRVWSPVLPYSECFQLPLGVCHAPFCRVRAAALPPPCRRSPPGAAAELLTAQQASEPHQRCTFS